MATETQDKRETLAEAMQRHGITVHAVWSQPRATPGWEQQGRFLQWQCTIRRGGRAILTADYRAGIGHCPSYKQRMTQDIDEQVNFECGTGKTAKRWPSGRITAGAPILPDSVGVLYSLLSDASVLNFDSFEDWASDYGYESDSRKAETIYRACLDIALKLRNGLGEALMGELQEAAQYY
jgi:hypothetical protein